MTKIEEGNSADLKVKTDAVTKLLIMMRLEIFYYIGYTYLYIYMNIYIAYTYKERFMSEK